MADENTESQPQTDNRPQGENRPVRNENRRPFRPRNNTTRPDGSNDESTPREGQDNRPPRQDNRPPRTDNRPQRNDNQPPRTNHLIRNPAPSDSATDLSTESENNARPQRSGGSRGGRRGSTSAPIDTNLRDFVLKNQEVHKNRLNPHLKLNLDNNEKIKITPLGGLGEIGGNITVIET